MRRPIKRKAAMFWVKASLLLLPLAIWFCCRWKSATPSVGGAGVTLRYSPLARLAAWLIFVLVPVIPLGMALILADKRTPDHLLIFVCCVAALAVLLGGLFAWRETRFGFVVVSPHGLQRYSPWWGMTEMPWRHIAKAELKRHGTITLSDPDGKRLTFIPLQWARFDELADAVDRHVQAGAIVH